MRISGRNNSIKMLNMFGCVGWLEESEEMVMVEEGEFPYLAAELPCRKTCGWTQCNTRCSHQHRGGIHFSTIKLSQDLNTSGLHEQGRMIKKAG